MHLLQEEPGRNRRISIVKPIRTTVFLLAFHKENRTEQSRDVVQTSFINVIPTLFWIFYFRTDRKYSFLRHCI